MLANAWRARFGCCRGLQVKLALCFLLVDVKNVLFMSGGRSGSIFFQYKTRVDTVTEVAMPLGILEDILGRKGDLNQVMILYNVSLIVVKGNKLV